MTVLRQVGKALINPVAFFWSYSTFKLLSVMMIGGPLERASVRLMEATFPLTLPPPEKVTVSIVGVYSITLVLVTVKLDPDGKLFESTIPLKITVMPLGFVHVSSILLKLVVSVPWENAKVLFTYW